MPHRMWVALVLSVLFSIPASAKTTAGLIVDAKAVGAIGDGSADDTAALQRALDGGHRTVVIPKGTYLIRKALLLDSATTIKAAPDAIVRLADKAGTSVDVFLLSNRDSVNGNSHVIVEGGIWDGNKPFLRNQGHPVGRITQCHRAAAARKTDARNGAKSSCENPSPGPRRSVRRMG